MYPCLQPGFNKPSKMSITRRRAMLSVLLAVATLSLSNAAPIITIPQANNFTCAATCETQMCQNPSDDVAAYSCHRGCAIDAKTATWPDDVDEYCHSCPVGVDCDYQACKAAASAARECLTALKKPFDCRFGDKSKPPTVLYVTSVSSRSSKVNSFRNNTGGLVRNTCVDDWGQAWHTTPIHGIFYLDADAVFLLFDFKAQYVSPFPTVEERELDAPFPLNYTLTDRK